jgi:hypothetical protein
MMRGSFGGTPSARQPSRGRRLPQLLVSVRDPWRRRLLPATRQSRSWTGAGGVPPQAIGRPSLMAFERIAHQPQCRRPEAHEKSPSLSIAALRLIDGLSAKPENDAEGDCGDREGVQVPAPDTDPTEALGQHRCLLPAVGLDIRRYSGRAWGSRRGWSNVRHALGASRQRCDGQSE